MPDLSNAQTVGGAKIVYDVDLRPLEEGDKKAQQIFQKTANVKLVPKLELDTKGAEKQAEAVIRSITGSTSKPLKLEIDPNHLRRSVGDGVKQGIEDGVKSATGGRGGFNPATRNALDTRGLGRLLGNVTGFYAVTELARLGTSLGNAQEIANHPERILRNLVQPLSGLSLGQDPFMQDAAKTLARTEAGLQGVAAFEAIPLAGQIVGAWDTQSRYSAKLKDTQEVVTRSAQIATQLRQADAQRAAQIAGLTGNPGDAQRIQLQMQKQGIQDTLDMSYVNVPKQLRSDQYNIVKGMRDRLRSSLASLDKDADRITANASANAAIADALTFSRARALNIESARGPGAMWNAMLERQGGETTALQSKFVQEMSVATNSGQANEASRRFSANLAELNAKQGKERADLERQTNQEVLGLRAQGQAALERANHQFFAAELTEFRAHAEQMTQAAAGTPWQQQVELTLADQRAAIYLGQRQQFTLAVGSARNSVAAAGLRGARRDFDAKMLDYDDQIAQARLLPGIQQGMAIARIEANRQADIVLHNRGLALTSFSMNQSMAASRAIIGNQPLTARAIDAITSAKLAIANADPSQRAQAIASETLRLQAIEHDLVGIRGGSVVSGMSSDMALAATGFGMDLGGIGRDRKLAAAALRGANLNAAIPGTGGMTDPGPIMARAAIDFFNFLKNKLSGITLYTAGS